MENKQIVKRSGCILINKEKQKIGLIFREKQQDFSFPKGHVEAFETLEECALRETEEETGRKCRLISDVLSPVISYKDSHNLDSEIYYFLAYDEGLSQQHFAADLVHELIWVDFDDVEAKLSYQNLIDLWKQVREQVKKALID